MILQTVIFTALATRRDDSYLYASVHVAPQLGGDSAKPGRLPLSTYTDFRSGSWARIAADMEWKLVVNGGDDDSTEESLPALRMSPDPDPALFATLFPDDMPVDPFTFRNFGDAQILSYPAARVDEDLDAVQRAVFRQSAEIRPLTRELVSESGAYGKLPLDGFVLDRQRRQRAESTIATMLAQSGVVTTPAAGQDGTATSVAMLKAVLAPSVLAQKPSAPRWPDLDFHAVVSLLQSHPNLLRRLGLLIDLKVAIPRTQTKSESLRISAVGNWPTSSKPDSNGVAAKAVSPMVRTTLNDKYFRPRPTSDGLDDAGFVRLDGARAITSTVESEALATETKASGLARMFTEGRETFGTPDRSGIPARHSLGVEIVRRNEAARWRKRMQQANALAEALNTSADVTLDAEDVVMGYRLDIRRVGQRTWQSLHRRHGELTPYGGSKPLTPVDLGDDEGWTEVAATGDPDNAGDISLRKLRVRESLAQWDGWSLSIPRPNQALDSRDRPAPARDDGDVEPVIATMHGTIEYSAPATGALLPALRFSTTDYEARMRWVDLAGNSEDPGSSGGSILRFPYLRHDPVPPPDFYLEREPVWSEASDVMVLRSGNTGKESRPSTVRWIAPPKAAAFFCLTHGVFDDADGRPKAGMYATIAGRESKVIPTDVVAGDVHIVGTDPGAVPYLPDPLASGLLIRGGPQRGATYDSELSVGYRGNWPNVEVARIEARAARAGANRTAAAGDSVRIDLEPGRVAHLRVSHSLTDEGLRLMDLWRRAGDSASAARARLGAYWMLTPDRVLTVVHASQRPVTSPSFVPSPADKRWRARRDAAATAAEITGFLAVDAPSTDSVNILGTRTYAVDSGPGTEPPYVVVNADMGVVGTDAIEDPAPGGGVETLRLGVRAAFADTTRQQVTLSAEGKSRFAEYFRRTITASAASESITLNGGQPVVEGSVRITWRTFSVSGEATDDTATEGMFTLNATRGILTLRRDDATGERIPSTAVLTVSFIPGPITALSTDRSVPARAQRASVTVPSSARPLAPQAEWILPAFSWSDASGARRSSTRNGGLLRIYLARPWFSSGIGEELAVVLEPANAGDRNPSRDALVTQWGLDPITVGGSLPRSGAPLQRHFTNTSLRASNVRLAEMDAVVDIVRYRIGSHSAQGRVSGYDVDRDMFFVDIEMDHGSAYRPFVRLALARYQPVSVSDLRLSPVTLIDVVQLEPDRTASVAINGSGTKQTASVTLVGTSYTRNELAAGPGVARAILERYDGPTGPKANPELSAAWTSLQTVTMSGRVSANGTATWTGRLTVASNRPPGRYRIVVEQFERIRTDGNSGSRGRVVGERLVHQDIIGI